MHGYSQICSINCFNGSMAQTARMLPLKTNLNVVLRGHVNNFFFQKSKKTLEVGGWIKCPIGKKKLENIFLYIILLRFWASIRTSIT